MRKTIVALASILAMSAAARADWQNTKWGMSAQTVLALPSVTSLSSSDSAAHSTVDGRLRALYHSPYQSGEFQFDAFYMFDTAGNLAAVDLRLASSDGEPLRGSLLAKYGRPRENYGSTLWWDAGDDELMFTQIGRLVDVMYLPKVTANNRGL